jgi:hypothetical protein
VSAETDKVIDDLLADPNYAHIEKKVIVLPGREAADHRAVPPRRILILEACAITDLESGKWQGIFKVNPSPDPMIQETLLNYYAPLAGVSRGDVPTPAQFMTLLPSDTAAWVEGAKELNPMEFNWLDQANAIVNALINSTQVTKKKSRKRPKSEAG